MAVIAPPLRPMQPSDIPDVLAVERAIFSAPWTEGMFRDELSARGRVYLLAEDAGEVAGYGGVMVLDGDAHLMTVAVVPRHRRRRLATRIVLALVEAALDLGASHLTLELRVSNEPARRLYEQFGFAPVGIRPGYYRDEDALVMWALDADAPAYRERLEALREGVT